MLLAMCGCVPAEREAGSSGNRATKAARRSHDVVTVGASAEAATQPASGEPLPILDEPFSDDFERTEVGSNYLATGPYYRLEGGRLCVKGARNHPLWLRRRLPKNARILVEASTTGNSGDIKVEAWGDGQTAATRISYTDASSYLAISAAGKTATTCWRA